MGLMTEIDFQKIEPEWLEPIDAHLESVSLMTRPERLFVNGLIRHFKPKKILEVGVWTGTGTCVVLNAMKDMPETRLHSIDLLSTIPKNHPQNTAGQDKNIGYMASEMFPQALKSGRGGIWTLHRGQRSEKVLDQVGDGIDFVVLDADHDLPGEIIDFLLILPRTTEDCVFVLHDINITLTNRSRQIMGVNRHRCGRLLMSTVTADKCYPKLGNPLDFNDEQSQVLLKKVQDKSVPNIGAFRVGPETRRTEHLADLFNYFLMVWFSFFGFQDFVNIDNMFRRYYPDQLVNLFEIGFNYNAFIRSAKK